MEFNTREHTVVHVPQGMLQDYEDSGKFEAWLPLHEDDNCYPLWWIVNCGVVGREYTVYPLKLLDDPIATSLDEVPSPHGTAIDGDSRWYTIDGRCLGTDRPTAAGLYITRGRKVAVM